MTSDLKHCQATPSWKISVPVSFVEIDNGDSWQAHADTRVVFVSSMKVVSAGTPVPASALRATAARRLGPDPEGGRYDLEGSDVQGDAQIVRKTEGLELKGFACADGIVATCVINFDRDDQREWAVATWRSLRPSSAKRPWWRFW
jgi:hypothetical protein